MSRRGSRGGLRWTGWPPRALAAACLLLSFPPPSPAAPEEIQVYLDDMTAPGRFGLDLHNNYVLSGSTLPDYAGAQPPAHVYRLTPEFYYGLSERTELGLYVLSTLPAQGDANLDGAKLRFKYVAPHDPASGPFWGANLELGDTSRRVSESPWNAELKGILGWRRGRWMLAANPKPGDAEKVRAMDAGRPAPEQVAAFAKEGGLKSK